MISVCIPVFNLDVRELAGSLNRQAVGISAEIILIDDGSDEKYRMLNRNLQSGESRQSSPGELSSPGGSVGQISSGGQGGHDGGQIRYFEIGKNIGRSKIRNRFSEYARGDILLFLDCDSVILSETFLESYAEAIRDFPGRVICGGRVYDPMPPERDRRLHWKYGMHKESQPASSKKQYPGRSFMTNNFLLPAHVLKEIPFDERISGYGHEDSLFGYELSGKGYEIVHIDNPVLHGELETNREFLNKTVQAVNNLALITKMLDDDPGFSDSITLLRTANRLESGSMAGIIRRLSILSNPAVRWILGRGIISLKLLDVLKLGLYLRLRKDIK